MREFGHKMGDGPGTEWVPGEEERVAHPEHTTTVAELLSDSHYDVFVRYGYAHSLVEGRLDEDYLFWKATYDKMQNRRVGISHRERFDALITRFEDKGFEGQKPIAADPDYELLDGSHRLACSAVFDIRPKVILFHSTSHMHNREWFEQQKFSEEELQQIDRTKAHLMDKFRTLPENSSVGVVWGVALEYWEEITGTIPASQLRRAFILDFEKQIEDFISESYIGDGMKNEHIEQKAKRLSLDSSKVGLIAIEGEERQIKELKAKIRQQISAKMDKYFFDNIIHIIDDKKTGESLLNKYSPKK